MDITFEFDGKRVERVRFEGPPDVDLEWMASQGLTCFVGFEIVLLLGPGDGPIPSPFVLDWERVGRLLKAVREVWPEAQLFLGNWES